MREISAGATVAGTQNTGERLPSVIFLIQWLRSGGAEKQVLILATELARRGVASRIVTLGRGSGCVRIESMVRDAKAAGVRFDIGGGGRASVTPRRLLAVFGMCRRSRGIVWSWSWRTDLVALSAAMLNHRARFVCSVRSARAERLRRQVLVRRLMDRRVSAYASNSRRGCDFLVDAVPRSANRCWIVRNALTGADLAEPPAEIGSAPAPLKVVMLGNVHPRKGYDVALAAVALLRGQGRDVEIRIAGRPDSREHLDAAMERLGLARVVHYDGEACEPLVHLRSGHVFLLSSRFEGMSNSLLEAMSLGLPCVATRVGDVDWLSADGTRIIVVEVGDVAGVAAAIAQLHDDWESAKRMGAAARAFCREVMTPGRACDDAVALLLHVAEDRSS